MKCKSCNKDIEKKEHAYCPYCGSSLKRKPLHKLGLKDVTESLFQNLEHYLVKKLFMTLADSMNTPKDGDQRMGPFRVKVVTRKINPHDPRMQGMHEIGDSQGMPHPRQSTVSRGAMTLKKRPTPSRTFEPKADYIKLPDTLRIEVELPEIESIEDIDIIKLENSCEIRAYKEDALYHKIIEIPENLRLRQKTLKDGILSLEFRSIKQQPQSG